MVEKVMETPMPETSSKLADLDYTSFLKKDAEHLSCPECEIIPAIFIEKNSKNLFSISSGCENQHSTHNMNVREFYQKSIRKNNYNQKEIMTLCQEHNEQYEFFCKTCHKNICDKCYVNSHPNHNMIKFQDIKPSTDEISKLKNSIKNEIKITSEFFTLEFYRWIEELKDKFDDLMDIISYKNKLYNKILSNYESGNLNYQIIHNIKVIIKDQTTRNPITKELGKLLQIITNAKKENKENIFNHEKNQHFLNILDIDNQSMDTNNNANTMSNKTTIINNNQAQNNNINNEKFLEDFINNPSRRVENINQNINVPNANNMMRMASNQIGPNQNNNLNNNNNIQLNRSLTVKQKDINQIMNNKGNLEKNTKSFYNNQSKDNQTCEFELKCKKVKNTLDLNEFIHSISLLKAHNSQKFALALESGTAKIFSFDEKSGDISPFLDIKEHDKSLTYVYGLKNGNLLTCSMDRFIKIINIPKSFFKSYSVVQTIECAPNSFYYQTAIEMADGNLIAGDWKNIVIWRPTKKGQDIEYIEMNRIVINSRTTALLQIDDGIFVSAHYGLGIINFFDTIKENTKTLKNIKCTDESPNCMCIISTGANGIDSDSYTNVDKILVIGGIQCMFFISVKYLSLIYKLFLPDVTYFKSILNTGYKFYSSNIMCCGLFNSYSHDLVLYNIQNKGGYNKFELVEKFRLNEADKSCINSILILKKKNSNDASSFILLTGGNEKKLKIYA